VNSNSFNHNPFIVIWELTRACALRCVHCRAEAQYKRNPMELSTDEGKVLLREIQSMGSPLFVFTGGDPLMREDLMELAAYGKQLGLRVAITPSATPRVTKPIMKQAKDIGFHRWAFSLDGSNENIHDEFRGMKGSYDLTINALRTLRELELPIQVNTTVCKRNIKDLPNIVRLLKDMGVVLWSVFFLIPTGRGKMEDMLSPEEHEEVLHYLAKLTREVPFDIKTTEAPHYRRVLQQTYQSQLFAGQAGPPALRSRYGIRDGNGFVFVSHIGDVFPSGFLPIQCGNIRETPLSEIYRTHSLFQSLRNPDEYKGKCGVCEYRNLCGGSRARAYAITGDPLESDPSCTYIPRGYPEQTAVPNI
jgi:radical SAM protein